MCVGMCVCAVCVGVYVFACPVCICVCPVCMCARARRAHTYTPRARGVCNGEQKNKKNLFFVFCAMGSMHVSIFCVPACVMRFL